MTKSETELREALREWWALWDNDGPGSGTHLDGPLNSIPGDMRERHARLLAIPAEPEQADEVAGLDVERLARAIHHYQAVVQFGGCVWAFGAPQDHCTDAAYIVAREYARLAPARDE